MSAESVSPEIQAIIDASVKAAIDAMLNSKRNPDDPYKMTLRRLGAVRIIQDRIANNKARLEGLKADGLQGKSKSIVRFSASGVRADPEEMYEAMLADLEAHIAIDEQEVDTVLGAMESFQCDNYYGAVYGRFIEGKTDDVIALDLFCDESTVRRNRSRLVRQISIRLYGAIALG